MKEMLQRGHTTVIIFMSLAWQTVRVCGTITDGQRAPPKVGADEDDHTTSTNYFLAEQLPAADAHQGSLAVLAL